jgi:hypothetical protein
MNLDKLYCITKFDGGWLRKFQDLSNINVFEELEQKMVPGESYKDFRQRLDSISRKCYSLRKKLMDGS